jgi:hypothetical protein
MKGETTESLLWTLVTDTDLNDEMSHEGLQMRQDYSIYFILLYGTTT